ncbi:MAG: hypothetical protein PVJ07_05255 [Anaerolineales bacterium]|jgi:hypothetical protein
MKRKGCLLGITAALMLALGAAAPISSEPLQPQTILVTSTSDAGAGSLREAIHGASPGDTIIFDPAIFPPNDPGVISIATPLPGLHQGGLTIEASDAGVILDGTDVSREDLTPGLRVASNGNVIRGLQVLNFPADGISVDNGAQNNVIGGDRTVGAGPIGQGNVISLNGSVGLTLVGAGTSNNLVIGNYIGTDPSGSSAWGNSSHGVMIQSAYGNTIGGTAPGEGNLISGNEASGVRIESPGSTGNLVIGNYIGTDASGTKALEGNNHGGVAIDWGASENVIGGFEEGERNLISGNGGTADGVFIRGSGTDRNMVIGNYIGLDVTGTQPLPNAHGVSIWEGASHNLVQGNVVSAHPENPNIVLWDQGTSFNVIIGNLIGTDATGTVAIPSAGGVGIRGGASENRIGGSAPGEGNLISGNGDGIDLSFGATGNQVIGNLIGTDITGSFAIPNDNGVVIRDAPGNIVGGSEEGEGNTILASEASGVKVIGGDSTQNQIIGNYIGTDAAGAQTLGNRREGVLVTERARQNKVGPGNIIAFNRQGIAIQGAGTESNQITQNSIHSNQELGITNADGGNAEPSPPTITDIGSRSVEGVTSPNATLEIFSDDADQGGIFEGSAVADEEGAFSFLMPVGRFSGPNVTATATDSLGNTSDFSLPETPPVAVVTRELPGMLAPTQVSVELEVVGTNLGLALFSVLFFGFTATVFNNILVDYRDELLGPLEKLMPARFVDTSSRQAPSPRRRAGKGRGRLVLMWFLVLLITSVVESFLDPEISILSSERLAIVITVLISGVIVSLLKLGSDVFARRRWAASTRAESKIQWVGIAIAVACVLLSRAMSFKPGYLYGIAGALYLTPRLSDIRSSGKRATVVLGSVFVGGLVLWVAVALLPDSLVDLEPILLTVFLMALQEVFFELFPLALTEGGDIWSWRKGVWVAGFTTVFFCFYHFLLNPNASDVQALQQNGVQTLLILIGVFGLATLLLWLLLPFRLRRKRARQG